MRNVVIPRTWIRWALTILVVVAVALSAANIYILFRQVQNIERIQVESCERGNALRVTLRGVLIRAETLLRMDGTLTPSGEAYYRASVTDLADVDCGDR